MLSIKAMFPFLILLLFGPAHADIWEDMEKMDDIKRFQGFASNSKKAMDSMNKSDYSLTVFALVDKVFNQYPEMKSLNEEDVLRHIVSAEKSSPISLWDQWHMSRLIERDTLNGHSVYFTKFVNKHPDTPAKSDIDKYGVNNATVYLYKLCTPMGQLSYKGTAREYIRDRSETEETSSATDANNCLSALNGIVERRSDVSEVFRGSRSHTFFLPNDNAFSKVDRGLINREVMLSHVSGVERVLFTDPWLYDGGLHCYPSLKYQEVEDNDKLKLIMRNITDGRTGRSELYIVSEVSKPYGLFKRGAVWAKILVPNIALKNGVAHIVDTVLGVVSNTIDQHLSSNHKCSTLMGYIRELGEAVDYISPLGPALTFFAPLDEAFDGIPKDAEKRILGNRTLLEQILKLHVIPNRQLLTDHFINETMSNSMDYYRDLYFDREEMPNNNITFYVTGVGTRAKIVQENVAATNGIIHYIDRVLGMPYESMWEVLKNSAQAKRSFEMLSKLDLKNMLNSTQNLTFFVPIDEAWEMVSSSILYRMNDGNHNLALEHVFKRHIVQGQALSYGDLRQVRHVYMNDEKVEIKGSGRESFLNWPRVQEIAFVIKGGEIAGTNGYIHFIDDVFIIDKDLNEPRSRFQRFKEAILEQVTIHVLLVAIVVIFSIIMLIVWKKKKGPESYDVAFVALKSDNSDSTDPQHYSNEMIVYATLCLFFVGLAKADLWTETERMSDLQQFRALISTSKVAKAYMEDSNARITVFAPIDDIFIHNPEQRALRQEEILSHFVATQVIELGSPKKWEKQARVIRDADSEPFYVRNDFSNMTIYTSNGNIFI